MNPILALIFISGFVGFPTCFILLFRRRSRRKAAIGLVMSTVSLIVTSLLIAPPHQETEKPLMTIKSQGETIPTTQIAEAETRSSAAEVEERAGKATICLDQDHAKKLKSMDVVELPTTTTFEDKGRLSGLANDPKSWGYKSEDESEKFGPIATTEPTWLTHDKPCSDVGVEIVVNGRMAGNETVVAKAGHIFGIKGTIDYPIPSRKPPIEFGDLVDDIGVLAFPTTDASLRRQDARTGFSEDEIAASCVNGARKLAEYLGTGIGRQTHSMVELDDLAGNEVTYGCGNILSLNPDIFINWSGSASPPKMVRTLIGRAANYVTGVPAAEISSESMACLSAALAPDAMELADRQILGAKIECQAFKRDGGGGSVTIYRRFGTTPGRGESTADQKAETEKKSAELVAKAKTDAENSTAFVNWWNDPSTPKGVKTFAALAARVVALGDRCPTAKDHSLKIAGWASEEGITAYDIGPKGRYFALVAKMISAMRAEVQKESVEEACANAARYD